MTKLDFLLEQATGGLQEPALKTVIEKEIIHHDILRILSEEGFLNKLTFVGGTCIRLIYGSSRYSEDLDFTGGTHSLKEKELQPMAADLKTGLSHTYNLDVSVTEPKKKKDGNVDTWKIKIITAPGRKGIPEQKINIDVALTSSQTCLAHTLINHYKIDLGTDGVIVNCQSEEEILADKIVAFVGRDKIKARDLWDAAFLKQRCDIAASCAYVPLKLSERQMAVEYFLSEFETRIRSMEKDSQVKKEFEQQMTRFLPMDIYRRTVLDGRFWASLVNTQRMLLAGARRIIGGNDAGDEWQM